MHKLLLDNNISHRLLSRIGDIFPNSEHVMLLNLDTASDMQVWQYAKINNFTILTKDSDFNDLAIYKGIPPKIIWIKVGNCKISEIENLLKFYQKTILEFLDDKNSTILEI